MNHQLKRSIQKAFAAPKPDPQEKARFLKTLPQPQIGMFRFILVQASYLRKATWILSGLILLLALFGARNMRRYIQTHVEDRLAEQIIADHARKITRAELSVRGDELTVSCS